MDADEATRVRQGACSTTRPEVLQALARDPSVTVRASLALNPALPEPVAAMLAADSDTRVRTIISRKTALLTPAMHSEARQPVQETAVANLTAMVAEAALRLRINVAEAVRDMPDGPREIVLRLAHDPDIMVCEPVLRFSPVLTQEDLKSLIASGPPASTTMIVAKRAGIAADVSDAIVEKADPAAIEALLSNHSARIRETTLDALAAQSEEHTAWQEPLVQRPHLSHRAQRMLSEIVTGDLLGALVTRPDLDPRLAQTFRTATQTARMPAPFGQSSSPWLATANIGGGGTAKTGSVTSRASLPTVLATKQSAEPDDHAILDALQGTTPVSAMEMLAMKAGVSVQVIERACNLRSAKAIVSLTWKGGMSAQTAVVLQTRLAHVAPGQLLRPNQDGGFPLSADEMRRQLKFLGVGDSLTRTWIPRRLSS